ncbi:MAG: thioredoxin domain-containing protein, partial [bacterium]|nr:thioredoxin domain-containing protein [bacterium]
KFWEMHKILFEKSPELSKDQLFQDAKDLGLDMDKFTKDFDSDEVRQKILTDMADGNKAGLKVTPTFFINGTQFDGALSLDEFSKEIDSRLK